MQAKNQNKLKEKKRENSFLAQNTRTLGTIWGRRNYFLSPPAHIPESWVTESTGLHSSASLYRTKRKKHHRDENPLVFLFYFIFYPHFFYSVDAGFICLLASQREDIWAKLIFHIPPVFVVTSGTFVIKMAEDGFMTSSR